MRERDGVHTPAQAGEDEAPIRVRDGGTLGPNDSDRCSLQRLDPALVQDHTRKGGPLRLQDDTPTLVLHPGNLSAHLPNPGKRDPAPTPVVRDLTCHRHANPPLPHDPSPVREPLENHLSAHGVAPKIGVQVLVCVVHVPEFAGYRVHPDHAADLRKITTG